MTVNDPRNVDFEFADGTRIEGFDYLGTAIAQLEESLETFEAMRDMGLPDEMVDGMKAISDEKLADLYRMRDGLEAKDKAAE